MDKDQKNLLTKLQVYQFAAEDLGMFLNTHPENEKAIHDFNYVIKKQQMIKEEYEKRYGPLTPDRSIEEGDRWRWIDDPWPWEIE